MSDIPKKINLPSQISKIAEEKAHFSHMIKAVLPRDRGDNTREEIRMVFLRAMIMSTKDMEEKKVKLQRTLKRLRSSNFTVENTIANIIQTYPEVDPLLAEEMAKFGDTLIQILVEDDPDKRYTQDIEYLQTIMRQRIVFKDKKVEKDEKDKKDTAEKTNTEKKEQKEHHGNLFITKNGYLAEFTKQGRKLIQNSEQQNIKVKQYPHYDNIIIQTYDDGKKTISRLQRDEEGNITYKDIEGAKGFTKIQHIQGSDRALIQRSDGRLEMIDFNDREGKLTPITNNSIVELNKYIQLYKLHNKQYIKHFMRGRIRLSSIEQSNNKIEIEPILVGYKRIAPVINDPDGDIDNKTGITIIKTMNNIGEINISLIFPDGTVNRDIIKNPISYDTYWHKRNDIVIKGDKLTIVYGSDLTYETVIPLTKESKVHTYKLQRNFKKYLGSLRDKYNFFRFLFSSK